MDYFDLLDNHTIVYIALAVPHFWRRALRATSRRFRLLIPATNAEGRTEIDFVNAYHTCDIRTIRIILPRLLRLRNSIFAKLSQGPPSRKSIQRLSVDDFIQFEDLTTKVHTHFSDTSFASDSTRLLHLKYDFDALSGGSDDDICEVIARDPRFSEFALISDYTPLSILY